MVHTVYAVYLSNCKCGIHFVDTIGYTHLVTSTIISDETNIGQTRAKFDFIGALQFTFTARKRT